jgi:hypothetical protein
MGDSPFQILDACENGVDYYNYDRKNLTGWAVRFVAKS